MLLLAHVDDVRQVGDPPYLVQEPRFPLLLQGVFQFQGAVEVIFDGALARRRDDYDLGQARGGRFLDGVLDDRLVDQGQRLFGLCFGCRQ